MQERKQPESLRLREAVPAMTANDIEKSVAWYRDVLGFIVTEEWRHEDKLMGAELKAGAVKLMLMQDDFKKGTDRAKGAGFRLYCTTVQDLDALAAAIEARGGELAHPPTDQPWGARDFAVSDPDGFKISIGARPEGS
jgi:uncharacterized glyoxalase superfamily protein PhnB